MPTGLKLTICAFALGCVAVAAHVCAPAGASPRKRQAAPGPHALNAQERRGRALYLRGESAAGREIIAVVGELDVPASTLPCAGCHGARGEGKTEAGVTAGSLVWSNLLKPYGHTHPSGRRHGPFNESAFILAVTNGVDPNGNGLQVAMPRYRMSATDMADLIAYLKRIEDDRDPGRTDTVIEVGVILPAKGALAETGAAMKEVLTAYFDRLNGGGVVYNRRVKLHFADAGGDGTARALATREHVFAFVGGISAGADEELAATARDEEIPFIGPSTIMPHAEVLPNRYVFYLLLGVAEQARALAKPRRGWPSSARCARSTALSRVTRRRSSRP